MQLDNLNELIEKAKQHDNDAITQLIKETQSKLYFVALSYVKKDADAQDVLQNSYIKAFSGLDSLTDASKFEAWLTRIVSNTALDFMKKASTRYDVKFTDMQDDENLVFDTADERIDTQPELAFSKKETEKIIKEIIDGLSDEQRVAVLMYFYDGMTTKEIAEEIGCKEATVKARIKYAKEKIKESVVTIQKRDGIKLYNIAPLPFFLLLLKGYSASGFASTVAIGTAAATTATTTASGVATATTAKVAGAVASKGILASTAAKAVLAGAVLIGGGTATYFALNNNNKTYDFVPGYYEDTNGKYSIQLDSDNTFDWYRDEVDGRYTSYGTYLIEGNTIILVIGEVGNRAGTCEFRIGDGYLSVIGGDATECVKGDNYTFNKSTSKNDQTQSVADATNMTCSLSDDGINTIEFTSNDDGSIKYAKIISSFDAANVTDYQISVGNKNWNSVYGEMKKSGFVDDYGTYNDTNTRTYYATTTNWTGYYKNITNYIMKYTGTSYDNAKTEELQYDTFNDLTTSLINKGYVCTPAKEDLSQNQEVKENNVPDVMNTLKENGFLFTSNESMPCIVFAENTDYRLTFINCQDDGSDVYGFYFSSQKEKVGWGIESKKEYYNYSYEDNYQIILVDGRIFDAKTYQEYTASGKTGIFTLYMGDALGDLEECLEIAKNGNESLDKYLNSLNISKEDINSFVTSGDYLNY